MTQTGASCQLGKWPMNAAALELPLQVAGTLKSFSQWCLLLHSLGVGACESCNFQSFWSLVRFLGLHLGTEDLICTVTEQNWIQIMMPLLTNQVIWAGYLTSE